MSTSRVNRIEEDENNYYGGTGQDGQFGVAAHPTLADVEYQRDDENVRFVRCKGAGADAFFPITGKWNFSPGSQFSAMHGIQCWHPSTTDSLDSPETQFLCSICRDHYEPSDLRITPLEPGDSLMLHSGKNKGSMAEFWKFVKMEGQMQGYRKGLKEGLRLSGQNNRRNNSGKGGGQKGGVVVARGKGGDHSTRVPSDSSEGSLSS